MHQTLAIFRPPSHRILTGTSVHYMRNLSSYTSDKRSILSLKDHVYFCKATAEGAGRNGSVRSFGDSPLDLKMSLLKTTGGKGDGQNPEQLFAMGYASCFLGALQLAAARAYRKELAENAQVTATVFLGHPTDSELNGFALKVDLHVDGCKDDSIIAEAHEFCPYSRALTHGAEVTITKD